MENIHSQITTYGRPISCNQYDVGSNSAIGTAAFWSTYSYRGSNAQRTDLKGGTCAVDADPANPKNPHYFTKAFRLPTENPH